MKPLSEILPAVLPTRAQEPTAPAPDPGRVGVWNAPTNDPDILAIRLVLENLSLLEFRQPGGEIARFEVGGGDLEMAKHVLNQATWPATQGELIAALTRCWSLTSHQLMSGDDQTLMLSALVEELSIYPRDAALGALEQWPREHKWWPSLAELVEVINPLWKRRRLLKAAFSQPSSVGSTQTSNRE